MGTDGDAVFPCQGYRGVHRCQTACVYPASDIGGCDAPHQRGILAALLAHVCVEVDRFDVGHGCNSCHIPGAGIFRQPPVFKGNYPARPLPYGWAVGLWFTAGRRKCWGEPGRLPGRGRLRAPHPVQPPSVTRVVLTRGNYYTPAPSGYSNASLSSRASVSTVVPLLFQAPSVSNLKSPIRRPHGAITRPIAR
jgi:hypothetical protein